MGQLRPFVAILALSLAACGDDDGGGGAGQDSGIVVIDARPDSAPIDVATNNYDLSCNGNAAPTTAAATLTVAGATQSFSVSGTAPIPMAAVKSCVGDCTGNNNLGSVTSAADGTFTTAAITTGGTPIEGYFAATKTGYLDTYLFPHAALTESLVGAPVVMVTQATVNTISTFSMAQDPANGIIGIAATDCGAVPMGITGAVISIRNAANEEVGDDYIDVGSLVAEAAGTYLITNVPVGTVKVTATFGGKTFLAHDVKVFANALTAAQVKPGY